jgi:hypothetical protein
MTKFGTTKRPDNFSPLKKAVPGPGQYTAQEQWQTKSHMTMGNKHYKPKDTNPGPGQYNTVATSEYYSKVPRAKIGTEKRKEHFVQKEDFTKPGPGQHTPSRNEYAKLSYTLKGRPQRKDDNGIPGPGNYTPQSNSVGRVKSGSRSGSISKNQRKTGENFMLKSEGINGTTLGHG